MIISSRPRRRLARITMLFGYVFNITIVSAFINVFLSLKISQMEHVFVGVLIPLGVLAVIFFCMRVPRVRAWGDGLLQRVADRFLLRHDTFNTVTPVDYIGSDSIAQVTLHCIPEEYQDVPLSKTGLRADTGIMIMLVEHPGKKAVAAGADTVFTVGDKLTVFGDYATIRRSFHAREHFSDS